MTEYFLNNEISYRTNSFVKDRKTIVFVHGLSGSCSAWYPYEPFFEQEYNIVMYDIRGHGNSKKYPLYTDYEIHSFAQDLQKLLDYLEIQQCIMVSNSFGTLIALEFIKENQDRVIGNILTSPIIYLNEEPSATYMRGFLDILTSILGLFPFQSKPRGRVDYAKHKNSTDWDIRRNLADMRNTTLRAHMHTLRQSLVLGQEYFVEKISIPTIIMHGEKDSMVPYKNAVLLAQKIPHAEFISIPNIDHNTAHNAVGTIVAAIKKMCSTL
ncbi:MAG: alpha/beta hydrolase [bacterium]